jgi:hypothetical protein
MKVGAAAYDITTEDKTERFHPDHGFVIKASVPHKIPVTVSPLAAFLFRGDAEHLAEAVEVVGW